MTYNEINDYFNHVINRIYDKDAFNEITHGPNDLADEMSMWIVTHDTLKNLNNTDHENLINRHFDDVVVMMFRRAKALNVNWQNELPADYFAGICLQ